VFDAGMDIAVIVFSFDGALSRLNWRRALRVANDGSVAGLLSINEASPEAITMIYALNSFSGAFHVSIKRKGYLTLLKKIKNSYTTFLYSFDN